MAVRQEEPQLAGARERAIANEPERLVAAGLLVGIDVREIEPVVLGRVEVGDEVAVPGAGCRRPRGR